MADPTAPAKVNLATKLGSFAETWVPKIVGELNGLLFEPASTRSTGNIDPAHTVEADALESI